MLQYGLVMHSRASVKFLFYHYNTQPAEMQAFLCRTKENLPCAAWEVFSAVSDQIGAKTKGIIIANTVNSLAADQLTIPTVR